MLHRFIERRDWSREKKKKKVKSRSLSGGTKSEGEINFNPPRK